MKVKYLIIHCTATRSNQNYTPDQLCHDHRARGFSTTGYHYYIRRSGETLLTRPLNLPGAHTRGYNHTSIGIAYEGGLTPDGRPADTRTPDQRAALLVLLRHLRDLYPHARIVGHRDLSPDLNHNHVVDPAEWIKACPCFNAAAEYCHLSSNRTHTATLLQAAAAAEKDQQQEN